VSSAISGGDSPPLAVGHAGESCTVLDGMRDHRDRLGRCHRWRWWADRAARLPDRAHTCCWRTARCRPPTIRPFGPVMARTRSSAVAGSAPPARTCCSMTAPSRCSPTAPPTASLRPRRPPTAAPSHPDAPGGARGAARVRWAGQRRGNPGGSAGRTGPACRPAARQERRDNAGQPRAAGPQARGAWAAAAAHQPPPGLRRQSRHRQDHRRPAHWSVAARTGHAHQRSSGRDRP